ncbi:MAG: SDR family oxidoreductase [Pyrinomonadaceae bacterium]
MPAQELRGFAEKVTFATGADSAIGRAVALQLALQGAYVVAVIPSLAAAGSRSALDELQSIGTLAKVIEADISTEAGAAQAIAEVEAMYGRLDLLVNVGGSVGETIDNGSHRIWAEIAHSPVDSAYFCTREAARLLQVRPSPAVVNVANVFSDGEAQNEIAALTAAAALKGMSRAFARQLGPKIRVNCVIAGKSVVDSELDGQSAPARPVAPTEVARSVVYLLSSDAKTLTGQVLTLGVGPK